MLLKFNYTEQLNKQGKPYSFCCQQNTFHESDASMKVFRSIVTLMNKYFSQISLFSLLQLCIVCLCNLVYNIYKGVINWLISIFLVCYVKTWIYLRDLLESHTYIPHVKVQPCLNSINQYPTCRIFNSSDYLNIQCLILKNWDIPIYEN